MGLGLLGVVIIYFYSYLLYWFFSLLCYYFYYCCYYSYYDLHSDIVRIFSSLSSINASFLFRLIITIINKNINEDNKGNNNNRNNEINNNNNNNNSTSKQAVICDSKRHGADIDKAKRCFEYIYNCRSGSLRKKVGGRKGGFGEERGGKK